ncbi:integrase [Lachnoclostridium sp. An169]|uniref:tyrosine-type recombinase/integrase n=1 Tax=Lachnoclostridium sp. An169 TaxID=1965569 RepID=UPI000B36AC04|nr:tyrosine-type recombinase/integrase [Lachnoclostridium sp. An169]OUP82692.1 integrase [Lachnoclostridium sp. An169]
METEFVMQEMMIGKFEEYLVERENSASTVEKYVRDVKTFFRFLGDVPAVSRKRLLEYKDWLLENYAVRSANSMLVALNQFLVFIEKGKMRIKQIRVQTQMFREAEREMDREEFIRLVKTARAHGREQLALLMETVCSTGIRISELRFFRVENVRRGMVKVWNKGKYRLVLLPESIRKKLLIYISKNKIRSGAVFCTRNGKEKDRSNIWKEMKSVAEKADIDPEKVFPHNLRHLFARTFYKKTKNLINLADILGHSSLEVTRIYTSEGIEEWKRNLEMLDLVDEGDWKEKKK